uniref:Uncharacterized protein n=1 Tax=Lepeophtheirus salmonis TaxID=72036 RepID=A0A0K2T999_LEPSM
MSSLHLKRLIYVKSEMKLEDC